MQDAKNRQKIAVWAPSHNGSQPNFTQCLALIHFRRLLLCNGILPGAKFTLHPPSLALSYWKRYCTAVEQWVGAKLWGIEHTAPPTFGRATIRLGIGPHSSFLLIYTASLKRILILREMKRHHQCLPGLLPCSQTVQRRPQATSWSHWTVHGLYNDINTHAQVV